MTDTASQATSADAGQLRTEAGPPPRRAAAGRYRWVAMGVVLIGTFMVILDSTIVNVALPQIGLELHQANGIEWIVTAYLLAVGLSTPSSGWLADRWGRKRVFMISLFAFATGSLLAALAPNLLVLIVFRVLQGLGGGAMMPVGMAMVYELFPPDERGKALGIWGVAAMAAPAFGPILGGYLVTTVSWRWLFLINVPIGYVGLILARRLLRDTGYREHRDFDRTGLALVGAGLILLLLAFSEATDWGWGSAPIVAMLTFGGALTVAFVVHELRVDQPLIDMRMFKTGTFSLTMLIVGLATLLQYGRLVFIPLELQTLRGYSAFKVGFLLTPSALGAAVTMPIGGRLADRIGARTPVVFGSILLTASAWLLSQLTIDSSILSIVLILALGGLGTGFAIMPNTVAAMNSVPARLTAQASAARSTSRQVAGAIGVAILSSIVASRIGSVSALPDTPAALGQGAYNRVFTVAAAAGLASLVLALGLPGKHRTKATQAQRASEADTIAAMEVEAT